MTTHHPARSRAGIAVWLATSLAASAATLSVSAPAFAGDNDGISSTSISRCAGKLGSQLRSGDQAFPLFSLDGAPWVKIEHAEGKVGGVSIATRVTGTGARHLRRGQIVNFRYMCLLDDKGEAVKFDATDIQPEKGQALPPATIVRGTASYASKTKLPQGAELRVQLLDASASGAGDVVTEVVVRSSWEQPIPFTLRLPMDTKLDGRKFFVSARLVRGSTTLYQADDGHPIPVGNLHQPLALALNPVKAGNP
jgi:uncharacterized lipoprotein YbaY